MSGHTPGEWSIDPQNGDIVAGPVNVAILYATKPEDKLLMTAAPCLLEALIAMTDHYVELADSGDCGFWKAEKEPQVIAARTAISRATGEVL